LRDAGDIIEDEGIRRAKRRAADADLKIVVFDGAVYPTRDASAGAMIDADTLVVVNKADLLSAPATTSLDKTAGEVIQFMSVKTGLGMDAFLARLETAVREKADTGAAMPLTRTRHRKALEQCREALQRSRAADLPELAAEDLRLAAKALGRLTGRVDVEEILDVVFRDFCIGK
jgi:tRNA modification GTPase